MNVDKLTAGVFVAIVVLGVAVVALRHLSPSSAEIEPVAVVDDKIDAPASIMYFCEGTKPDGKTVRTNVWSYDSAYVEFKTMPGITCQVRGSSKHR